MIWLKSNWIKFLLVSILVLCVLYFLFSFDIGLNSAYFIKRDFTKAFDARTTGNCDEFGQYINEQYAKAWFERCLTEKERNDTVPISNFEIKNITTRNSQAFLQVDLVRKVSDESNNYTVNYEMIKSRNKSNLFKILPQTRYLISQHLN